MRTSFTALSEVPCGKCGVVYASDSYGVTKHRNGKEYIDRRCKKCIAKRSRERYRADPKTGRESNRVQKLKHTYGLSVADYEALLAKQDGRCAICRSAKSFGRGRFHIDHDHATGSIRGLLCHHCNLGLGNFKDNIKLLRGAEEYLNATYNS